MDNQAKTDLLLFMEKEIRNNDTFYLYDKIYGGGETQDYKFYIRKKFEPTYLIYYNNVLRDIVYDEETSKLQVEFLTRMNKKYNWSYPIKVETRDDKDIRDELYEFNEVNTETNGVDNENNDEINAVNIENDGIIAVDDENNVIDEVQMLHELFDQLFVLQGNSLENVINTLMRHQ
jgi:hypothetical protein